MPLGTAYYLVTSVVSQAQPIVSVPSLGFSQSSKTRAVLPSVVNYPQELAALIPVFAPLLSMIKVAPEIATRREAAAQRRQEIQRHCHARPSWSAASIPTRSAGQRNAPSGGARPRARFRT
jgi:hypothetical protein